MRLLLAAATAALLLAALALSVSALPTAAEAGAQSPTRVAEWCRQLVKTDPEGFPRGWVDCLAIAPLEQVRESLTVVAAAATPAEVPEVAQSIRDEARRVADAALARASAGPTSGIAVPTAIVVSEATAADGADQNGCTTAKETRDGVTRVTTKCISKQTTSTTSSSSSSSTTVSTRVQTTSSASATRKSP